MLPDPGDGLLLPVRGLGERRGEWDTYPSWPHPLLTVPAIHPALPLTPPEPLRVLWAFRITPRLPNHAEPSHPPGSPSLSPECEWGWPWLQNVLSTPPPRALPHTGSLPSLTEANPALKPTSSCRCSLTPASASCLGAP